MNITEMIQALAPIAPIFLSVPLIQAIVKMSREAGVPGKFCPFIAILIGLVMGVAVAYIATVLTTYPVTILYIYGVFLGIQAGAAASGFYDAAKYTATVTEE